MFDFNEVTKDVNNKGNNNFNKISLDLLNINPCKLFYSLYSVPVIGKEVSEIKNYYYMDNVWDTTQYSYRNMEDINIPNKLMQYILKNPKNKYSIIYSGKDYKASNNSNRYSEFFNYLKQNHELYFFHEGSTYITIYKNEYFTIFELKDTFIGYFITLNTDKITEDIRTYNKVVNSYNSVNNTSDYDKVTENLHTILDYKTYVRHIVFDLYNGENKDVNINNKLLVDGKVRYFNDIYNNKAYFIYNTYNIYDVCRLETDMVINFLKLLLLPDDTMLNIIKNIRNSDYTCTAEINGNKLNIHITDNLDNVPEYIKLFYTHGYKIQNNNEKLRAIVIDIK